MQSSFKAKLKAAQENAKSAEEEYALLKSSFDALKQQDESELFRQDIAKFEEFAKAYKQNEQKIKELEEQAANAKAKLNDAEKREKLKEKKNDLEQKLIAAKARYAAIKENEDMLKNGICPFIKQPCEKIGEISLSEKAAEEVKETKAQLEDISKEMLVLPDMEELKSELTAAEKQISFFKAKGKEEKNAVYEILKGYFDKLFGGEEKRLAEVAETLKQKIKEMKQALEEKQKRTFDAKEVLLLKKAKAEETLKSIEANRKAIFLADKKTAEIKEQEEKLLLKEKELEQRQREYNSQMKDIELRFNIFEKEFSSELSKEIAYSGELKAKLSANGKEKERISKELKKITDNINILNKLEKSICENEKIKKMLKDIKEVLKKAGPHIAGVYRRKVGAYANAAYKTLSAKNEEIVFAEDYDINVVRPNGSVSFKMLSGGEKMSVALAFRLGFIRAFGANIGFFDEPTEFLDVKRKQRLPEVVGQYLGGFEQAFIISHDDTFESIADNVIIL